MTHMTFVDNTLGLTLQSAGERDELLIELSHVHIFGENENSDNPVGQSQYCPEKRGLQLFGGVRTGKELHPTSASALPIHA